MMSSLRSAQQGPELTSVTISPNNPPDLTYNYTEKGDSEEVNHKSKTNLKYSQMGPFFHYPLLVFIKNVFSPKFDMPY